MKTFKQFNEGALADRMRANNKAIKAGWDRKGEAAKKAAYKALKDVKDAQAAMAAEVGGTDHNINLRKESIERQAKDRKKLSQPHSVSGSRRDHSHDVDSALTDHVSRKGKGRVRPASKKEMRVSAMRDAGISAEIAGKDHSIDLKKEETVLEWGWKDHKKAIEQRKIRKGKAVPYDAMLVKKKSETVAASHEPEGKLVEEIEGGVSVETYTKGIQFQEVETIDIIKPEPLRPSPKAVEYSDWRIELDK